MGWSISRVGRREAVLAAVAADIGEVVASSESERSIKAAVGVIVTAALAAFPMSGFDGVSVEASGDSQERRGKVINRLSIRIDSIDEFLE